MKFNNWEEEEQSVWTKKKEVCVERVKRGERINGVGATKKGKKKH